jgi:hypothetical protein
VPVWAFASVRQDMCSTVICWNTVRTDIHHNPRRRCMHSQVWADSSGNTSTGCGWPAWHGQLLKQRHE